jgi:hypothetical protein
MNLYKGFYFNRTVMTESIYAFTWKIHLNTMEKKNP